MPCFNPSPLTKYLTNLPHQSRELAKQILVTKARMAKIHCPQCWTYISSRKQLLKLHAKVETKTPTCLCRVYAAENERRTLEGFLELHYKSRQRLKTEKENPHKVKWKINIIVYTHPLAFGDIEHTGRLLVHAVQPVATFVRGIESHEAMLNQILGKQERTTHVCIAPADAERSAVKFRGQLALRRKPPIQHATDFSRNWWHHLAGIARSPLPEGKSQQLNVYVMQAPRPLLQGMLDTLPPHVHRVRIGPQKLKGGNWYLDRYVQQPSSAESVAHFLNLLHLNGQEIFSKYRINDSLDRAELDSRSLDGIFLFLQDVLAQAALLNVHESPRENG